MRDDEYIHAMRIDRDFWHGYEAMCRVEARAERRAFIARIVKATLAAASWLVGLPVLGCWAFGIENFAPVWVIVGNVGAVVLGSSLYNYVKYGRDS